MKITTKAIGFELTPSIQTYVEEKLNTLSKLVARYDAEGAAEVRVELRRTTRHHKSGPEVFEAEANLRLPGRILNAVHDENDVRVAVDRMKTKLRSEILKFKDKSAPRSRKAGAGMRGKVKGK